MNSYPVIWVVANEVVECVSEVSFISGGNGQPLRIFLDAEYVPEYRRDRLSGDSNNSDLELGRLSWDFRSRGAVLALFLFSPRGWAYFDLEEPGSVGELVGRIRWLVDKLKGVIR